jgi:hypothetical protein
VSGFIYLDVDIGVAQSRVAKRGRTEESAIPSEYQRLLHAKHAAWMQRLEHPTRAPSPISVADCVHDCVHDGANASASATSAGGEAAPAAVLRLDCSRENSPAVVAEWIAKIDAFLPPL